MNPFRVVRDFEAALCEYTGAPYAVTTTSCTMALLLAVAWHLRNKPMAGRGRGDWSSLPKIEIPKRTYVGVAMSIIHAGGRPTFRDQDWVGAYELRSLNVWDSARWFTWQMYANTFNQRIGLMQCVSFHWSKTLGIEQGGAILHDNPEADRWLRKARFDGRTEGVAPAEDVFDVMGYHAYMAPETAAAGLVRLANLPRHNDPLAWDDYPDLSQLEIFR